MIDEDNIIAAYIRTNYPEMLKSPAYLVYKATYMLVIPAARAITNAFQSILSIPKEDENE